MKKGALAELKSTYDTGFLTSCIGIDELINNFKERQDEFDNGGIFVEIYDKETVTDSCVNVSKIAACIRKYTIKGDVTKDLAAYLTLEVDILDTPMGRKLVNNDSAHNIEAYLLFNSTYKKFLIVNADEYSFIPTKEVSCLQFSTVSLLTKQEEVSDNVSDTELLEKVLPMLRYSIDNWGDEDTNIVDIKILESNNSYAVNKSFVFALQNRINELAKKTRVEATNIIVDEDNIIVDEDMCGDVVCKDTECNDEDEDIECCPSEDACEDTDARCVSIDEERGNMYTEHLWDDCTERTYSSKEYHKLESELVEKAHEIWKLKRTVEALEYLIYNCIPEGDRRKY